MGIETLYRCDHCGWIQTNAHRAAEIDRNLWQVSITLEGLSGSYYRKTKEQSALWCQTCLDESGIQKPLIKPDKEEPSRPTFEDLVRQIIEDYDAANKE